MTDHVSPSQLDTFTRCARQWMYRYVDGLRRPPGAAAYTGKGAHKAAEFTLRQKLEARKAPSRHEVEAIAADAVRAEWEVEPPHLDAEDLEAGADKALGLAVDGAVSAAACHLETIAPRIVPIAVEAEFRIEIAGLPAIVGVKDVETAESIRDLKTGKKSKSQADVDASPQLTIYALEAHLAGRPGKTVAFDSIAIGKKGATSKELTSTRDEADFGRVLDRLSTMDRMVKAGIFPPADPTSWICSRDKCGYWDICPHGGKRQVLVQLRR